MWPLILDIWLFQIGGPFQITWRRLIGTDPGGDAISKTGSMGPTALSVTDCEPEIEVDRRAARVQLVTRVELSGPR
jgi:hypothetical protein